MSGRRITILGMGPSANERRHDIGRYVEGTEVWSLNNAYIRFAIPFDRMFELHTWGYLKTWQSGADDHFRALDALDCPVWVGQPLPVIRRQMVYPFLDVFKHFGSNYFLGSPSLMLVLAIYEHDHGQPVEYIQSYGIDTADPTHGQQRPSWAWWLAFAHQRGIQLGGTATAFFGEYERDDGLRGLRETIGDAMAAEQQADAKQESVA